MKEVQKHTFSNSKSDEFKLLKEPHEKKLKTHEPKEKKQKLSEVSIIPG